MNSHQNQRQYCKPVNSSSFDKFSYFKFKTNKFAKLSVRLKVRWVPPLLEIVEGVPQVGNMFSKFLCYYEGIRVVAAEGFTPSG